jgi:hypothetical protein
MNYIISQFGFLKEIVFDKESNTRIPMWEQRICDVTPLKSKKSINRIKTILDGLNIQSFVWNPMKEYKLENKWEVVMRSDLYDFYNDENHKVLEWIAVRRYNQDNDLNRLSGKINIDELYSEEVAKEIAKAKNIEMLEELSKKINK